MVRVENKPGFMYVHGNTINESRNYNIIYVDVKRDYFSVNAFESTMQSNLLLLTECVSTVFSHRQWTDRFKLPDTSVTISN